MKKITAILLIISIACIGIGAICESTDETYFPTYLLNAFEFNAKEWMMSESNRALFAVCALVDYVSLEDIPYDTDNILRSSILVGRSGFW